VRLSDQNCLAGIAGVRADWLGADRDRHLFLNRFGSGIGPNAVWHVVHKYVQAANIGRAVSTHTFRDSCAMHMLRAGARLRAGWIGGAAGASVILRISGRIISR
jgi:site-specific recombinase XerD